MFRALLLVRNNERIEELVNAIPFAEERTVDENGNGCDMIEFKEYHWGLRVYKRDLKKNLYVYDKVSSDGNILTWKKAEFKPLKYAACGSGMQSTAMILASCNKKKGVEDENYSHVPIYSCVIFILFKETLEVMNQTQFISEQCEKAGIPFFMLEASLYDDYMNNFGESRVVSIPFWTQKKEKLYSERVLETDKDGNISYIEKDRYSINFGRGRRNCTLDYKINRINNFIKRQVLGYKLYERLRPQDDKKRNCKLSSDGYYIGPVHEMHIGFSFEEKHRCKPNPHPMFENHFPLVKNGLVRSDNYGYIYEVWNLKTKASACNICPFHRNYFFKWLKESCNECNRKSYEEVVEFDNMLERQQPKSKLTSEQFISRSHKRIRDLTDEDCNDAETFIYTHQNGIKEEIWNGF